MAVGAAFVGALAQATSSGLPESTDSSASIAASTASPYEIPCPPGQLPDEGVCVPVPVLEEGSRGSGTLADGEPALPLRADRPTEYESYMYPVEVEQRAGQEFTIPEASESDLAHALRIPTPAGALVKVIRLEGQVGPTKAVFATHGPPAQVITAHEVQRERGLLTYLLVHSDLESVEAPLLETMPSAPIEVAEDARLGKGRSQGITLALRQMRRDTKLSDAVPDLSADAVFAVDPRNLLPLRRSPLQHSP